jgi:hypothetical protein
MPYATLQLKKIKSFGSMGASQGHTTRDRNTPNANPNKQNIRLIGMPHDPNLSQLFTQLVGKQTIRKNAVLIDEMVLSASPEYFRPHNPSAAGEWEEERLHAFSDRARNWLKDTFDDHCIRAELHLDEATPHIHAYVVPLDERGKLSHDALFGTRWKLSALQDSYAKALEPLGISRGIKGSRADYQEMQEFYAAVKSKPLSIELERMAPSLGETAQAYWQRLQESQQIQALNAQLADLSFLG